MARKGVTDWTSGLCASPVLVRRSLSVSVHFGEFSQFNGSQFFGHFWGRLAAVKADRNLYRPRRG